MKQIKLFALLLLCALSMKLSAVNTVMKDEVISGSSSLLTGTKLCKNSDKIYYLGTDRKLYSVDLSQPSYPVTCISDVTVGGYITAADYSDLVYDSYHIYYVGTNNKVVNYYLSGSTWYCATLNASSQSVHTGGSISVDNAGRLFYIGSNGGVYQFTWSGSWVVTALPAGQAAGTYSDLYAYNNHVFYIGTDNKVYNYYLSGATWLNAILNTGAPTALSGTCISMDEYDRVFYVASDNKVYHYTYSSGWSASAISNTTVKSWASPKVQKYCGKIYYIDNAANTVSFFYYTSASGWTSNNVYSNNNSTATIYSLSNKSDILITDNGDLVYNSAVDNKLHLLSPQITWKTVTIASGLTSMINGSAGTETSISITKRPFDFQFYPRNSSNIGTIPCEGSVWGYGDITWKIEKTPFSGAGTYTVTSPTGINQSTGDFTSSLSITAELSEYKISYKLGCQTKYTVLADKVVCGDAFIASGQSNMHAADGELNMCTLNSNFGATSTYGKYSRSFGDNITESRTWGIPSANNDITAYYDTHPIGALILPLQYKLQQTYGIPTCFINNALGGTSIDAHQLNATNKFYFEYNPNWNFVNIEGHLMRRVYAAGLETNIKGFVWYQGESEVNNSYTTGLYKTKFKQLYDGLAAGIPSLSSSTVNKTTDVYMVQIHSSPGSYPYANMVGEDMRTMSSYIPYAHLSVVSSNGAKYPNCSGIHFNEVGYEEIATRVYNEMKSGSFGATYNVADFPLNIVSASKNASTLKVSLVFNQPISNAVNHPTSPGQSDDLNNVLNAIYLPNNATKSNPVITGNTLTFTVSSIVGLTSVSYLGSLPSTCNGNYSPACPSLITQTSCTPGPQASISTSWWCPSYLKNGAGIAALSFHNIPVPTEGALPDRLMNPNAIVSNAITKEDILVFPNPAENYIEVSSPETIIEYALIDSKGVTLIKNTTIIENNIKIDVSMYPSGIYTLLIKSKSNTVFKKVSIIN